MSLPSSGEISLDDIIKNRTGTAQTDVSLQGESVTFASGSTVAGDTAQTSERFDLIAAPFNISEFYDADFTSDVINNILLTTAGGGSDKNSVDGENVSVSFTSTQGGTHTVELVDSGGNVDDSETRTGGGSVTFSSLTLTDDTYDVVVRKGFVTKSSGSALLHHDQITMGAITDPSDKTVANNSATTTIEHAVSITNDNAFNDINWTFSKVSGDGSAPSNLTGVTDRTPSVNYTGAGIFSISCRVDGLPSQARNSADATNNGVQHRIDFTENISVDTPGFPQFPGGVNEGGKVVVTGTHRGFSGGVQADLIKTSDSSIIDTDDQSSDSRIVEASLSQSFDTPTNLTDTTLSAKVKIFNGSTTFESDAFNIYPLISEQFGSSDLVFGASAVEVNQNVTLNVANDVSDNIVGYQWSNQGTGALNVQSGNSSAGDTDGSSSDSTSIIDLSSQSHPTVQFTQAEQNKTVRLTLFGRNNQTAIAEKNIDVELADALSINSISNLNRGSNIQVTGNHSGFQNGVTVGIADSGSTSTFQDSSEETDETQDSRFTQRSFDEEFLGIDVPFTQTLVGRVVADVDGDAANTSTFNLFPQLRSGRNVIQPNRDTIFSDSNNPDTSTFPTTVTYSAPSASTDNLTQTAYSTDSLTGHSFTGGSATSHSATTAVYGGGSGVGDKTIKYDVQGNIGQASRTTHALAVDFAKNLFNVSTPTVAGLDTVNNQISFSYTFQGFTMQGQRFQLINTSDNAQDGNDSDTDFHTDQGDQVGTRQTSQTRNITLTSTASTFNVSAAGTYFIRIRLFSDDAFSTQEVTADSGNFVVKAITEITSTFKGVVNSDNVFIGYASKLLAAENNSSSEGTANQRINQTSGGGSNQLFVLAPLEVGATVGTNSSLTSTFDGNAESGQNFFNNDGSVVEINGSDGVIDSITDGTPATLNAVSEISDATDDVTIRITGNTTVTRVIQVVSSVNINSKSMASFTLSEGTGTTQQNSSFSVDKSLKTLFGAGLNSGTTFGITVRGVNEAESGSLSSNTNVTTDALVTSFTTSPADFTLDTTSGTATSSDKQYVLSNGSGDTVFSFAKISGDNMVNPQFAVSTSSSPSSFQNPGNDFTLSGSATNYFLRVRHDFNFLLVGNSAVFRVTATNNSVSDTLDITLRITDA